MNTWRPASHIRVKALGLHWRDGRLLAAEVYDDAGRLKGVRPLGGSVEFGETFRDALIREFREELGIDIAVVGEPAFFENIYVHEGAPGHEVVALFDVRFPAGAFDGPAGAFDGPAGAFDGQDRIIFREDTGDENIAGWFDPAELDLDGGPALYPTGLKAHLLKAGG